LCVFELDPMPTETKYVDTTVESTTDPSDSESPASDNCDEVPSQGKPVAIRQRPDYIALAQRRLEPIGRSYLHHFTMRVFGTPLLLRLVLTKFTGSQLYELVSERMQRFAPIPSDDDRAAYRSYEKVFQNGSSTSFTDSVFEEGSCVSDAPIEIKPKRLNKTMDMEQVAAGVMPRYGFRLRLASRDGSRCSRCLWYGCCIGCEIPDDDNPAAVQDGDTIVIDWHLSSPASRCKVDGGPISAIKEQALSLACVERHISCRFEGKDITLEECLDKFTKEEEIPDVSGIWFERHG